MPLLPVLLIGGIAAIYFLRMGVMGQNISFIFRNIKIKGGTIIQPNVIVTLGVQNPTNTSAVIRSVTGRLIYEGKTFATFSNFTQSTIKGNSETVLDITAIPNFSGVIDVINNVIVNRRNGAEIKIIGTANVNNIVIPINSSFSF
jgi:hypothetical protein